jgi:hypothetical protein
MRFLTLITILTAAVFLGGFYCTKVEYTNPLDSRGTRYVGDSVAVEKKSTPQLSFVGPDTVVIAKGDPLHVLAGCKVTATDVVWGNLTDSIKQSGSFFTTVCSTFTVTYSVTNQAGYSAQKSRTIIVDCMAPDIVLKGDNPLRLKFGTAYVEPGATATDNIDGVVTSRIKITGSVNSSIEGTDTVTYSAADSAGNVGTMQRVVIVYKEEVKDTLPPILTLKGDNPMTLFVNGVFADPGYLAVDPPNMDTLTNVVVTGGPVLTTAPGNFTLTYTAKDASNNVTIKTRTVNVQALDTGKDVIAPVITFLVCSSCTTKVGQAWGTLGYTALDNHDGDVTSKVVVVDPIPSTASPGTFAIHYTVTDSAGNKATYIRTLTVVGQNTDTTRPTIHLDGAVRCTVSVGKTFTEPGYSAEDNIDGVITNKVTRTLKTAAGAAADSATFTGTIGNYVFTYAVTDKAGNSAVPVLRYVMVKDTAIDTSGGLLTKYGVPQSQPLATISASYTTVTTEGTGPKLSNWTKFTLNWNLPNKGLYEVSFNTSDGVPSYYLAIQGKITNTFDQAGPSFVLTGSGVSGLDGTYYITASTTQCVWVKKDGSYAIVFK